MQRSALNKSINPLQSFIPDRSAEVSSLETQHEKLDLLSEKLNQLNTRISVPKKVNGVEHPAEEMQFQHSGDRYKILSEASGDLIFEIDLDDNILFLNDAAAQLFNQDKASVKGKARSSFFTKEVNEVQKKSIDKVLETKNTICEENKIIVNQSDLWLGTTLVPIFNNKEEITSILGVSRNITEQKKSKLKIEQGFNELKLIDRINQASLANVSRKELIEQTLDAFAELIPINASRFYFYHEKNHLLSLMENKMSNNLLKKIEKRIGFSISTVVPPLIEGSYFEEAVKLKKTIVLRTKKEIVKALADHSTNSLIKSLSKWGQKIVGINSFIIVPLVTNDTVFGIMALSSPEVISDEDMDRIERFNKQIVSALAKFAFEEELKKERERYQLLVENLSDAILLDDSNGKILYANKQFFDLFGFEKEDLDSIRMETFIVPEYRSLICHSRSGKIQGEQTAELYEFEGIKKNGSRKWFEIRISPVLENGQITGRQSIIRDISERKQTEMTLLKSEFLLREAQKIAKIGSWEWDLGNNTMTWSDQVFEILEMDDSDQFKSLESLIRFIHPEDLEYVSQMSRKISDGQHLTSLEYRIITKKGNVKYISEEGSETRDEHGNIIQMFGVIKDITETKLAEHALQNAFEEKNIILDSIGDAFFTVDKDWTVTYWNQQAEDELGIEHSKIIGKNLWEFFPNAIETSLYFNFQKAVKKNEVIRFEEEYHWRTKSWYEISAYPSSIGLSVYFKNINIRKHTELALLESEQEANNLFEYSAVIIWEEDFSEVLTYYQSLKKNAGSGMRTYLDEHPEELKKLIGLIKINKINKKAYEFSKISEQDDFKEAISSWFTADSWEVFKDEILTILEGKTDFSAEIPIYDPNSNEMKYLIMEISVPPKYTETLEKVMVSFTDITERKLAENKLMELNIDLERHAKELAVSNADLEQFAFIASHDLQEPLRMISSFLTLLEKKYESIIDEKGKKYIHFATDGARRMHDIILALLEYSRISRIDEKQEEIDTEDLLREILILNRKKIDELKARITWDEFPQIVTEKVPMRQIFQNLIGNALKYHSTTEAPKIKISSFETETHWQFSVSDNGIGIEEANHEKIFTIFQRLHSKNEYEGTGIGLAICKKIVDSHGGEIWLESVPGQGSTFFFTLEKNTLSSL